jgi:hypothetical protein
MSLKWIAQRLHLGSFCTLVQGRLNSTPVKTGTGPRRHILTSLRGTRPSVLGQIFSFRVHPGFSRIHPALPRFCHISETIASPARLRR